MISKNEVNIIKNEYSGIAGVKPIESSITDLFALRVREFSSKIALDYFERSYTYGEIDWLSDQIAAQLIEQGVSSGDVVGIFMKRSPILIISQLAVLKAGAAYLPLDPFYPADRLQFMIADSGATLILKDDSNGDAISKYAKFFFEPLHLDIEEKTEKKKMEKGVLRTPLSSAYIIYTSGTTGQPKGVEIPDRGVIRLVNENPLYSISEVDVTMFSASVSFDASVLEIWSALLNGATLVILPAQLPSLEQLSELMNMKGISAPFITTPLFHQLIEHFPEAFNTVSRVWTGGDVISRNLVAKLLEYKPDIRIFNCYGPTENSVVTTVQEVNSKTISNFNTAIPIGRPIPGTTVYILDENMQPVPIGAKGELYTGGLGVAKGYINQAALTEKMFIRNPFSSEKDSYLYKTGDIVRYTASGEIEFIGRKDNQVKIRGYRIELGEIEMRLSQCSNVFLCVVEAVPVAGDEKSIVAYIVPKEKDKAAEKNYREELSRVLPGFMLPSYFVILDSFSLTSNGKIDRKNLPMPVMTTEDIVNLKDDELCTPREAYVKSLWLNVLKCGSLNRYSNFLNIGGHSLHAAIIVGKIRKKEKLDISVQDLFETPILQDFAMKLDHCPLIAAGNSTESVSACIGSPDEGMPLSSAQERVYFLEKRGLPAAGVYNIPVAVKINGIVDVDILRKSISYVVGKHELLRAAFRIEGEQPKLSVLQEFPIPLSMSDLSKFEPSEAEHLAQQEISDLAQHTFDLENGELFLVRLIKLATQSSMLVLVIHHLVCDGWSLGLILQDIGEYYNAAKKGIELQPARGVVAFRDYVNYERIVKDKLSESGNLDFWKNELEDHPECINLPLDSKRPKNQSFKGGWLERCLSTELSQKVRSFAKSERVTVYSFLLSVFNVLLAKYTSENDTCVGTPFLNRGEDDFQGIVGFFANSVVLRNKVHSSLSFTEFLQSVHKKTLQVFKHAHVPFEEVVKVILKNRTDAYNPIFQVVFSHQDFHNLKLELQDAECRLMSNEFMQLNTSKFDLSLFSMFEENTLSLQLEYAADIFNRETVCVLLDRFVCLIKKVIQEPTQKISEISLLDKSEQENIIYKYNKTDASYPRDFSIAEIFRKVAAVNQDKAAVICEDQIYTYSELDKYSDCLASELAGKGGCPGSRIAICMKRSPEQILAILAILKCGASYVPIDLNYPVERIQFMIKDTCAVLGVVDRSFLTSADKLGINTLLVDLEGLQSILKHRAYAIPDISMQGGGSEAYVLYTSGSTGVPKGIMVPNRAITRLVLNTNYIPILEENTFLHAASLSFDAATFEIWAPLLNGHKLVLYPGNIPELEKLGEILKKNKVTHCWLTTGLFNSIIDEDLSILKGVPFIFTGGEKISEGHVRRALKADPAQEIINGYGPTENTTFTTTMSSKNWNAEDEIFPIGYPIANTKCYILDEAGNPVPEGIIGDLYTDGDGLALGYLNNEELTKAVFISNPFRNDSVMYKTGDKARYRRDGAIEYIGRSDDQVKIRGFRIEIKELEKALCKIPEVLDGVVVVSKASDIDKKLVAYFTAVSGEAISEEFIRRKLAERLPEYMIPSAFVQLSKLPLTINGKVDRKKLPEVDWGKRELKKDIQHPNTLTEKGLCDICKDILHLNEIDMGDEFFALGGHSLLIGKLVLRINKKFGVKISIGDIFVDSTLRGICTKIDELLINREDTSAFTMKRGLTADVGELSFSQQRLWLFDQINPSQSVFNMPIMLKLKGPLDINALEKVINVLISRHRSLRTNFVVKDENVIQIVNVHKDQKLEAVPVADRDEALRMAHEECLQGFDLGSEQLIRHRLLRISDSDHILLITMNHIISDGWSFEIYLKELSTVYDSLIRGERYNLKAIEYDYIDFMRQQKEKMASLEAKRDMEELSKIIESLPTSTTISCDYERRERAGFYAERERITLSNVTTRRVQQIAKKYGVSMNMILMACFHVLIYRLTGQDKIVTGSPITNREGEEFENVIGFFVNNLVNVTDMDDEMTFSDLLHQVRNNSLSMYRLGYIPFEVLLDLVKQERRLDRTPVFQMMFNWIENQTDKLSMGGLQGEINWDALPGSKFDLTLYAREAEECLKFDLVYDAKLFKRERMKFFLIDFEGLLEQFVSSPNFRIIEPELRSNGIESLPDMNKKLEYRFTETVIDRFERNRIKNPEKIIIEYALEKLSYQDISNRVHHCMTLLIKTGFRNGDVIPVLAERNPELIISLLAILKLGCCFSIIDARFPLDRVRELICVTGSKGLINVARADVKDVMESLANSIEDFLVLDFSSDAIGYDVLDGMFSGEVEYTAAINPETPMYICFTSGSTGTPKAVVSPHAAVMQSLNWFMDKFTVREEDRFVNLAGVSHDPLIRDIFLPLCANAKLYIPAPDLLDRPAKLGSWMSQNEVSIMPHITPSMGEVLSSTWENRDKLLNRLRLACFVGETLMGNHIAKLLQIAPNAKVVNFYGATEAPQVRSFLEIDEKLLEEKAAMPVGKGISDTQLLVLNKAGKLCGVGEIGEIYIRTPYLSWGYLGDEESTCRAFQTEPGSDGRYVRYKTGDYGRFLPSGNIEFGGRQDRQVKIRGYRVELDEIEKKLNSMPGIQKAVVKIQKVEGMTDSIVAFYVASGERKVTNKDMRHYLSKYLPQYMIPVGIKEVDRIPLNKNGKVDYHSLIFERVAQISHEKTKPRNEIEELIFEAFTKTLNIPDLGIEENFFDVGGNSLLGFQIINKINTLLYTDLSLKDIFLYPTIEALAYNVENILIHEDSEVS